MEERINPYFEVNGEHYEIKPTRYLIAEANKLIEKTALTSEQQTIAFKGQKLAVEYEKAVKKCEELQNKFFETFETEDERKYENCVNYLEKIAKEFAEFQKNEHTAEIMKMSINNLEKIAIMAIQEQYTQNYELAKQVWEQFVTDNGEDVATEWLQYMENEILLNNGNKTEVDQNSFIAKMRAKNSSKKTN